MLKRIKQSFIVAISIIALISLLCACSGASGAIKDDIKTKTAAITNSEESAIKAIKAKGLSDLSNLGIKPNEFITDLLGKASISIDVEEKENSATATVTVTHFDVSKCSELMSEKSAGFKKNKKRAKMEREERLQLGQEAFKQSVEAGETKETTLSFEYKKDGGKWITEQNVFDEVMNAIISDEEATKLIDSTKGYAWTYDKMNASQILEAVKDKGVSIGDIQVFNEKNDPNQLLGRPGEYTSKASFIDTRVEDLYDSAWLDGDINIDMGGTVEVFETAKAAQERENYINGVISTLGFGNMYSYRFCNVLFRVGYDLTPSQAADYEKAFLE